jgi:hypothetical protein
MDYVIAFGVSAVFGLAVSEQSGHNVERSLGGTVTLTLPAEAWQYGLWLALCLAGGALGAWIASFGGRAEITMRSDGIQWLLGKRTLHFFPYAAMQRCELARTNAGSARLRIVLRPAQHDGENRILDIAIPKRVDLERVRALLHGSGIEVDAIKAD